MNVVFSRAARFEAGIVGATREPPYGSSDLDTQSMLFKDDFERTEGRKTSGERMFEYLQRLDRPETKRICQWANEWFEEFPFNEKCKFENRIKSREDNEFIGALFEMQVHSILRRLDFSVEIEADFPGTKQKLDFLAHSLEGQSVYVEATVRGYGRGELYRHSNERDAVEKVVKNIPFPHSNIWLEMEGVLLKTLGEKDVVKPFRELLERYSQEEVRRIYSMRGSHYLPSAKFRERGWVLKGTLWPSSSASFGGIVLGRAGSNSIEDFDCSTPFSEAVHEKAKKWRKMDFRGIPFLIAVNVCDADFAWSGGDEIIIRRALFKKSGLLEQSENFRESLSHVSGVIIFTRAVLTNETSARVRFIRNGDAHVPERLHFLFEDQRLGDLLGIGS